VGSATAPFVRIPFSLIIRIRFRIISSPEYLNNLQPAVLVANHQADLDIIMLTAIWPRFCSVVAKIQTKRRPFIGAFVRECESIFVERNDTT
jgi:lysophosphatidate acyltransferase